MAVHLKQLELLLLLVSLCFVVFGEAALPFPSALSVNQASRLTPMMDDMLRVKDKFSQRLENMLESNHLNHFLAGVAAGAGEWFFGHPFDTLKVRTMASANAKVRTGIDLLYKTATPTIQSATSVNMNMISGLKGVPGPGPAIPSTASAIVHAVPLTAMTQIRVMMKHPLSPKTGFLSLYRGSVSELTSAAIGNSMLFGVNHFLRHSVFGVAEDETQLTRGIMLAAAGTGLVDAVVYKPLEYMKVQMQMRTDLTFKSTMRSIYEKGGVLLFYRGVSSSILRDMIGNMGFFSTYHVMKHKYKRDDTSDNEESQFFLSNRKMWTLVSGATAGVVYELVSFPFETAAVVMQLDHARNAKWPSALHCVSNIYRDRGFVGLYRGIGPTLVRALPAYAASFYMYEYVLDRLKEKKELRLRDA